MRKAKPLNRFYQELSSHDTVVTADAGLADALRRRLDRPVEGKFAATPRRLAFTGRDPRRQMFIELAEKGFSWPQASYALDRVLDCWKHTGSLESILGYEDSKLFEDAVDVIGNHETSFQKISEASVKAAAANPFQFNALDRSIFEEREDYSMLTEEEYSFPEFQLYSSGLELVKAVVENVSRLGPENCGVVVHPETRYQVLLESQLGAAEIPYTRTRTVKRLPEVRAFLSVLEIGNSDRRLRVRDAKPVAEELGIELSGGNTFLDSRPGTEELKEFLNAAGVLKVEEILERFEEFRGSREDRLRSVLEDLGILKQKNSSKTVERLRFFLEEFEPVAEQNSQGLLLADPRNATVVDRPVVFFLGMTTEWSSTPENPWIDREWFNQKNRKEFQVLLQSGSRQVYMAEKTGEDDLRPAFEFSEVLDRTVEAFTDFDHRMRGEAETEGPGFQVESNEEAEFKTFSQSELNSFAESPRLFFLDKLVEDREQAYLRKGRLFHDFAEASFHCDTEKHLQSIREVFLDEMRELVDEQEMERIVLEVEHGLKSLESFDKGSGFRENYSSSTENFFAEKLGLEVEPHSTELSFRDEELGVSGKIDLVDGNRLVDYKSGERRKPSKIVEASRVETFEDAYRPDFQPLIYILYHSRHVEGEIEFTYYYFLEDLGPGDDDKTTTVTYYPESFNQKASSTQAYEYLIRGVSKSNDRRKTLEKLGFQAYQRFFREEEVPRVFDKDEMLESELAAKLMQLAKTEIGDYKYVEKGVESALKKLVEFRNQAFFRDDLEKFQEFVDEKLEEANRYEEQGYPVKTDEKLRNEEMVIR